MSKTTYERGKTLTYPSIYPMLTFTPIFGHRGDFVWIEKVMAAWPEHDSEFAFVNSTMHDERVDRLKAENAKLRELVSHLAYVKPAQVTAITHDGKLFRFDEKLAEVGMRYEAES